MLNKLKPTIAIVDSGIGGISVLKQLIAKYNFGNYIYFADNLYMPYGRKTAKFIKARIEEIVRHLNEKYKPDFILIACNTASSVIANNEYKNVKVMKFDKSQTFFATKLTSSQLSGYKVIPDCSLASLIEKNIENKTKLENNIKQHSSKHELNKFNTITLGCTHFELVKPLFEKYCNKTTFLCNSASLLENLKFKPKQRYKTVKVLLTKKDEKYERLIYKLINEKGI